jgi:excisionase family DNA binding protein
MTVEEIARHLRTSSSTVYKLKERGEIRGYRVGRQILFDPDEVDEDIKQSQRKKAPDKAQMGNDDDKAKREIS